MLNYNDLLEAFICGANLAIWIPYVIRRMRANSAAKLEKAMEQEIQDPGDIEVQQAFWMSKWEDAIHKMQESRLLGDHEGFCQYHQQARICANRYKLEVSDRMP